MARSNLHSPRSLRQLSGLLERLVEGRLWLKVLVALGLGLMVGMLLGPSAGLLAPGTSRVVGDWLAFPGRLFLAAIQMIVIPLVFASIVRGLAANDDPDNLRRNGIRIVGFFVIATAIAAGIGIALAETIQPGRFVDAERIAGLGVGIVAGVSAGGMAAPGLAELPETIVHLLPGNPLGAMVEGQMLQVVIFAVVVGIALVSMAPATARPLIDVLGSVQEVCMTVVRWAMLLAPLAVFGLTAQLASRIGLASLLGMGVYVITVLIGLAILLVGYAVLVRLVSGMPMTTFLSRSREVLLLAFSTSSSAAVMPLSIRTAEDGLGVRPSLAQFVIPLGTTINMTGTALYQAVAAMFLAQVFGVEVSPAGMGLVIAMTVGASIGSPATPGVGIVILSMVVTSIGVPAAGVALVMGVDRILDMARTAVNVSGDLAASRLMETWSTRSEAAARALDDAHPAGPDAPPPSR
jgi:Na+/H+-dicarboxylate symporter